MNDKLVIYALFLLVAILSFITCTAWPLVVISLIWVVWQAYIDTVELKEEQAPLKLEMDNLAIKIEQLEDRVSKLDLAKGMRR